MTVERAGDASELFHPEFIDDFVHRYFWPEVRHGANPVINGLERVRFLVWVAGSNVRMQSEHGLRQLKQKKLFFTVVE
jgi:hypothetical protein